MHAKHATYSPTPSRSDPAEAIATGLGTWRALTIDLPLRLASESMRFTSRRLQAQADHLAALAGCGSLEGAFALNAEFLSKGVSDYKNEANTLSHDVAEAAFARVA